MAAPQTQFEIDGTNTTLATESAFLAQIAAETSATHVVAGKSDAGRDINRVDIGNPAGTTMVVQTLMHGSEPMSREACLMWFRDLAYSTDPTITGYLSQHRVVLITPISPDAQVSGGYGTTQGDPNKDMLKFATAPARVLMNQLHEIDPHLVVEAHEMAGGKIADIVTFGIGTLAVNQALRDAAQASLDAIWGAVQAAGRTVNSYGWPGRVSGREAAALHHAAAILLETHINDPRPDRASVYRIALDALREWHEANAQTLIDAKAASKADALSNEPSPYLLQTGDIATAGNWPVTELPSGLAGYKVTGELPAEVMAAYGVVATGDVVSMSQEARAVVPLLFDPASDDVLATATRIVEAPIYPMPTTEIIGRWIRVGGVFRRITATHR